MIPVTPCPVFRPRPVNGDVRTVRPETPVHAGNDQTKFGLKTLSFGHMITVRQPGGIDYYA
jgi:hypothetical protein